MSWQEEDWLQLSGLQHFAFCRRQRGKPKEHSADELQLCAQAMCLEEMLRCAIPEGALYYGEPHRRTAENFWPGYAGRGMEMSCSAGHIPNCG